jgi:hypothetical protein
MRLVYHGIEAKTDSKHRRRTTGAVISSVGAGRCLAIFSQFAVEWRASFTVQQVNPLDFKDKSPNRRRACTPIFDYLLSPTCRKS